MSGSENIKTKKIIKSAIKIKEHIEFRFRNLAGEDIDNSESYKCLSLFSSFPEETRRTVLDQVQTIVSTN